MWPYEQVVYMRNSESVLVNETHNVFWDFKIQTEHLISTRRLDLEIAKKKKKKKSKNKTKQNKKTKNKQTNNKKQKRKPAE